MFFTKKINFEEEIKNIQSQLVQGKLDKVNKSVSKILKNKDFPENLFLDVARIYFELTNFKESYIFYQKSDETNLVAKDLFNLVEITLKLELNELCQEYCNKVLEFEPNNIKILDILLQMQIKKNQLYSAIEIIDKMLVLQKNIVDFNELKFLKAKIFFDIKEYDNSEGVILELLATDENNVNYLTLLSNIYREKNMTSELLTVLKKIFALTKQIQDAREIATILFNLSRYNEVEDFILSCDDLDFFIKKLLLQTNIEQKKYSVAIERVNHFLSHDKDNFELYKLKSQILIKKMQFKTAIDLLENCVDFVDISYLDEINQLLKNAHIEFSKYMLSKKNYEQAFAILEDAVKFSSDDDEIYFAIAKCNLEICDYKKALFNLSKAIEINPLNYEFYELSSQIYFKNENLDMAIKQQFEAVKINPQNYYSVTKLAFLYAKNEDFLKALEYYQKALSIASDNDEINYNIALCYHKLNQLDNAKIHYQKALELNSLNSSAQKNLDIINIKL